jgi:tetratricopeptide (TPR) repeat protein
MRPTARPDRRVGFLFRASTLILVNLCLHTPAAAQIKHLDPAAVLDAYAQGRYDEALTPVRLASRDQAREFRQRLVFSGGQWVDSVPSERARRALIAAAFALEAERVRAERGEWTARDDDEACAGRCVIEWACTLLQSRGVPDDAERIWMLASIALAGGVRDWTFLQNPLSRPTEKRGEQGHVQHAIARMPDEPRFRLARAVALASRQAVTSEMDTPRDGSRTEQMADPYSRAIERSPFLVSVLEQRRATLGDYAREQLDALVADPSVGTEARLRLGYLHWVRGDAAEALTAQRAVAEAAQDPDLRYLANFLAAQAAQALGDFRAAEMRYAAALSARPHSQSATLGLAALLYSRGEAKQAYDLVAASRDGRPRDDDPWRMFLYGDFAKLPVLVGELRRVVQP